MSDSIKLSSNVLNASDYKKIFGDVEPRTIAKEELAQSADFKQLMSYVLTHFGNEGLLRNRRDTIILFLIRPDGVDTYRAARNAVSQFEQANEKKLIFATLPNGDRMLDGLSGNEPLPAKGNLADMYALRQTTRKHVPRDPTTGHQLLQERKVLVRDGRVILYADPDKEIENAIKSRLKFLIGINDIQVGEFNYIADVKKAEQMIIDFNSDPPKNKYFDITLRKAGRRIDAQLEPTEESGEEPQDAVRGIFQTVLRDNQRKWYLNYLVEPNSFEAYIAIRKVTDSAGFFAGWQPIYPGSYPYVVFSGYQIGVKPPPPTTPPLPRRPMPIKGVLD